MTAFITYQECQSGHPETVPLDLSANDLESRRAGGRLDIYGSKLITGFFTRASFLKQTEPGRNLNYWAIWAGYKFSRKSNMSPTDHFLFVVYRVESQESMENGNQLHPLQSMTAALVGEFFFAIIGVFALRWAIAAVELLPIPSSCLLFFP
jgi:hypothetical protein